MASYIKRLGSWQARTNCKGVRQSATFPTKAEAIAWATQIEAEVIAGKRGNVKPVTFGKLLEEYAKKVSPTKKGERWEVIRINLLCKSSITKIKLADLTPSSFAEWRDKRLKEVSPASVRREWNLISSAINTAIKEWGWLKINPLVDLKRPIDSPPRDRIISASEADKLSYALGYEKDSGLGTVSSRVGCAMLFAIETGMRAGEIERLKWSDIDGATASTSGKTLSATRKVPLSKEAVRLLNQLPKVDGVASCFGVKTKQIDALFRKARDKALLADIHFHDTRHTAVTKLAKKLSVLDLARMIGHRDLRMLQIYYNESASDIAKKLD